MRITVDYQLPIAINLVWQKTLEFWSAPGFKLRKNLSEFAPDGNRGMIEIETFAYMHYLMEFTRFSENKTDAHITMWILGGSKTKNAFNMQLFEWSRFLNVPIPDPLKLNTPEKLRANGILMIVFAVICLLILTPMAYYVQSPYATYSFFLGCGFMVPGIRGLIRAKNAAVLQTKEKVYTPTMIPENADSWNDLGFMLDNKGDIDGAIDAYRKAIEIDPEDSDSWNDLGFTLNKKGDVDGAINAYRKAIDIDPKNADAWNNLGFTLEIKDIIDEAVYAYRKAVEIDPKNADAWNNLGNALDEKSNLVGAIEAYHKAIEIDPKNANAWNNLGLALEDNGDLDGAVSAFRKAVELDPEDTDIRYNLVSALDKKGDVG